MAGELFDIYVGMEGVEELSINMVGTAQCDPQEGTKNTQMGSVMCFGHG